MYCPNELGPNNVTVNGYNVDAVTVFNERYLAGTSDLMPNVSKCSCSEKGLSSPGFFMIEDVGPWIGKISVVIKGTAYGCGSCKKFRLCISSKGSIPIEISGCSTFAIPCISLPCTVDGMAPVINFQFDAIGSLLMPSITSCGNEGCSVTLCGKLVIEPTVELQVTRQTLFKTNAEQVMLPCDDLALCNQCSDNCGCNNNNSNCNNNNCNTTNSNCNNGDSSDECPSCRKTHEMLCCQFNGFNGCSW